MSYLIYESFAGRVNETFALSLGDYGMDLTLVQARKQPVRPYPGMMREPFSLRFKSPSQVVLPQRIYPMRNQVMGRLDIFIVPVGRDPDGIVYEAVFN